VLSVYFFADPRALLRGMGTDHSALLTEAAFPPSCAADVQRLGRFCASLKK
jgi:hypothetical protein